MLRKYLPIMLQDVDAFMSKHDVQSGARWSSELSHELETSSFGVLCLAPENLQSPWLLFEAGALTKHIEGRACGLLLRQLKPTDVTDPLSQFQHQVLSTEGFFALLRDINTKLQKPLDPTQLELVFDKWWPDVDREYQDALKSCVAESYVPPRDERDILEEILGRIRFIEKTVQRRAATGRWRAQPDSEQRAEKRADDEAENGDNGIDGETP
jgi:hypothetical protein